MSDLRELLGFIAISTAKLRGESGASYSCCEDYVFDRGKEFESSPLSDREMQYVMKLAKKDFPPKMCFSNAQDIVTKFDKEGRFRYVEGYCFSKVKFPVLHAWVVIDGKVFDPTLRTEDPQRVGRFSDRIIGTFESPRAYVGVEFPVDEIRKFHFETGMGRSLLDDWSSGWPLLRQSRLKPLNM